MAQKGSSQRHCMFCGRKESEVPFLLQGLDGFICSDCVELAHDYIADTVQKSVAKSSSERIDDKNKPGAQSHLLFNKNRLLEYSILSINFGLS